MSRVKLQWRVIRNGKRRQYRSHFPWGRYPRRERAVVPWARTAESFAAKHAGRTSIARRRTGAQRIAAVAQTSVDGHAVGSPHRDTVRQVRA